LRDSNDQSSRVSLLNELEIPAVEGITNRLQARASALHNAAQSMESAAMQQETEAAEDVSALKYMRQAQEELNAYAANFEGLTTVAGRHGLTNIAEQFPREAAELHALIDHSLSRDDAIAVRLARQDAPSQTAVEKVVVHAVKGAPILSQRPAAASARSIQHAVHRAVMIAAAGQSAPKALKRTKLPRSHSDVTKEVAAADGPRKTVHGPSLAATPAGKPHAKGSALPISATSRALAQLQRVKAFARTAATARGGPRAAEAAALSRALAATSPTQMLVQPGPLHGALPVRAGALRRSGTLWNPKALGWVDYEPDLGDLSTAEVSGPPLGAPASWKENPTRYSPSTWHKILLEAKAKKEANATAGGEENATEAESEGEGAANATDSNATAGAKPKWRLENDVRLACNQTCQKAPTHPLTHPHVSP
jgi:hypothetical protein